MEKHKSDMHSVSRDKDTDQIVPRILVVEDDITTESFWRIVIGRAFLQSKVYWSTSEPDAVQKIERAFNEGVPFDLVISDIFLSGPKTGLDLWEKYHEKMHGRMILTSSIDHMKMIRKVSSSGQTPTYLKKPLVAGECIQAIFSALQFEAD